jgi:hypothetical protein
MMYVFFIISFMFSIVDLRCTLYLTHPLTPSPTPHRWAFGVERSREYIAVFLVTWGLVLPFVVFQSLLSARDDYRISHYGVPMESLKPTAVEVISPLLVLLGGGWVLATLVSCSVKTAYEEARERVQHDAAGLRALYHI